MKATLQSFLEQSHGYPYISVRAMQGFIKDFWAGIEFSKPEMKDYYLAKEMLCCFAENCAYYSGDYFAAQRFHKKRDKANIMRKYILGFNIY